VTGAVSGLILIWFVLPRRGIKTAAQTLKAAKKDPDIAPIFDKTKEIIDKLHPLVEQFKNLDLAKFQKDAQPLLDAIKKIDPQTIDDLLRAVKELANSATKAIEKPKKIPKPH
jgi:uncharacterized protein YoxC